MFSSYPSTRTIAKEFTVKNDFIAFVAIFGDWTAIFLLFFISCYFNSPTATFFCLIGIGYFQFALGEAIVHDASHYNLFRIKAWHDRLDFLYALPFVMTLKQWRIEHMSHHQRFGAEGDHLVSDYASYGLTTTATPNMYWICFARPILGLCMWDRLRWIVKTTTFGSLYRITVFWITAIFTCAITGNLLNLALYWLFPLTIIYPIFLYWSEIGDHYRTLTGTRSRTGFIYNVFWHNNGYHSIHHRFPQIPFHQLAKAHRSLNLADPDAVLGWIGMWRALLNPSDSQATSHYFHRPAVLVHRQVESTAS